MLAHELRNPLAPIRNAGELLSRTVAADPQARAALASVERQVRHLTRLVQCVVNILTNAAKYTPPDGEIRVESGEEQGEVRVSISDNGVGLAPDLLPDVFDLFVQGERTLDRAQGGLGVGLTIVRRLIEMHGGSIAAASAGVNQGATFEIRLPVMQDVPAAAEPASTPERRPRRILVVDDNADGAKILAALMSLDGHEVEVALSGQEALDRLDSFRPNVALVDIGLPGLDGYEVARRIRASAGHDATRLIAITGYGRNEDRERGRAAGFDAHLVKPVAFAALQRAITETGRD